LVSSPSAFAGGAFGAGIGILMLAAFGFIGLIGLTSIHRMNGSKIWGAFCINVVAAGAFALSHLAIWPIAGTMAVGAIAAATAVRAWPSVCHRLWSGERSW
jgi:uncharacterized protein